MSATSRQDLTVLDRIIRSKRAELAKDKSLVTQEDLESRTIPSRRGFLDALRTSSPAIITEIKKASPSAGVIREDFKPGLIARSYEKAGAAALSVLTDKPFFQGSLEDLTVARNATALPVLRKDFTLDRYHVLQASSSGADCVLLIAAVLTVSELKELHDTAKELGLDVLVEVHNHHELERALLIDPDLIGVNNRNLKTLKVSLQTSLELATKIPDPILRISESGIHSADDIKRLTDAGYQGFLIGECLMRQVDPGRALEQLLQA